MKRVVKTLIIFISLFMFSNIVMAKDFKLDWSKTIGETNDTFLYMTVDSYDGMNYYVGGVNSNSPIFDATSSTWFKGVVSKYDKDGNLLWKIDEDDVHPFYKVKGTSDGGVVALGMSEQKTSELFYSTLTKYDKDGKVEWKTEITSTDTYFVDDWFNVSSIYLDSTNGNYIIVIGSKNINLIVVSKDGKVNRNFNISSLSDENNTIKLYTHTIDNDNYIVFFGEKKNNTTKESKLVMYKFDTNGYLVSDRELSNIENNLGYLSVDTDNTNNYVLFRSVYNEVPFNDKITMDEYFYYFDVYDKSGKLISSKEYVPDKDEDRYYSAPYYKLNVDYENNYIVRYCSSSGSFFQYKFDKDLNVNKSINYDLDNPYDLLIDKYNNYVYVGGLFKYKGQSLNKNDKGISIQIVETNPVVETAFITKYSSSYDIITTKEGVGEVESSTSTSKSGDTVTIKATPGDGYRIDKITVTDKFGNNIDVVDNKFVMPASDVTIKVVFTNAPIENPKTGVMNYAGVFVSLIVLGIVSYKYIKSKSMVEL